MSEALLALGVVATVLVHTLLSAEKNEVNESEVKLRVNTDMNSSEHPGKKDKTPTTRTRVSIGSLELLAKSNNLAIRESALQILLTRAMSKDYFGEIMLLCWDIGKTDPVAKEKAICVVQQLSRTEANRITLVKYGAMPMLAHTIKEPNCDKTYRNAVMTLYRLVLNNASGKVFIVKSNALDRLVTFLTDRTFSNDLRYWSLLVIHQLASTEMLHPILVFKGLIPILGSMTRSTFGNSNMQKYCVHAVVRLVANLSAEDAPAHLQRLLDMNMVSILGACLKNDDADLVAWAIFLIQEFVARDVARVEFSKVRGIAKTLVDLIGHPNSNSDTLLPRVCLRTLKCLTIRNETFQAETLKQNVIKRIIPFLESADTEAQFWSVSLLHDLIAANPKCHEQFIALRGLEVLIRLCNVASTDVCLYVSDVFIFLCGNAKNRPVLLQSDMLPAITMFCNSSETDLQYSGALLMLNLATFSVDSALKIEENDGIEILADLIVNSTRQDLQIVASKALSTMSRKEPEVHYTIFRCAVLPIVQSIIGMKFTAANSTRLHTYMECLQIFLQPNSLKRNYASSLHADSGSFDSASFVLQKLDFNSQTKRLCLKISDMLLLPFISESLEIEEDFDGVNIHEVELLKLDLAQRVPRLVKVMELLKKAAQKTDLFEEDGVMDMSTRYFFAFKALGLVSTLFQDDAIKSFLEKNEISTILLSLIRMNRKSISDQAISCLAMCLMQGLSRESLSENQGVMDTLSSHILVDTNPPTKFYGDLIVDCLADCGRQLGLRTAPEDQNSDAGHAGVQLDLESITPYLCWSKDRMEVRNDSWTFESVRSNVGVKGTGKFAYEILIHTDGIIQIGWATAQCTFDPEGGEGVGDNSESYAFDGNRMKKWHSIFTTDNDYGEECTAGDVITSLLDLDNGTVAFLRNGNHLGIAFLNIDVTKEWFPAASLSGGQGCTFMFGGQLDVLKFLPDGYAPFDSVVPVNPSMISRNSSIVDMLDAIQITDEGLGILVAKDHDWKVPSMYYEARFCPFGESGPPFEIGLSNGKETATFLLGPVGPGRHAFLIHARSMQGVFDFNSLHENVLQMWNSPVEHGNESIKIVAVVPDFAFVDGDVFGCGYDSAADTVCFTMNGVPFVLIQVEPATQNAVLPYVRNTLRFKTNYGNSAFAWYPCELERLEEEKGEMDADDDDDNVDLFA
ncbi:hypothetical protein HDU78_002704 [Chytriomyces hyalinus]|nr:hypothetical protein HDU78_002704 [Chytriomyces hyalinus]